MNILSIPARVCWLVIPCCLLAIVAVADDESVADSDADSGTNEYLQLENCIRTSSIRRTDIIDDRTIVFYMHQKKIYINQLQYRCSGLRIAGTFGYRPFSSSRLCDVDTITVLRPGTPVGTGPTCGLGKFRPVTEEELAMIKNKEPEMLPEESTSSENFEAEDTETENSAAENPDES